MPFPKFEDIAAVWVEKTKSSHGHGGKGWEFGTCLWSPVKDKSGKRIYKTMLAAQPSDLVIHFYEDAPFGNELDHYLCGLSVIDTAAATIREEPPLPGDWAARGDYYRIGLREFKSIQNPVAIRQFVREHEPEIIEAITGQEDPPFVLYNGHIRLAQGKYLSHCGGSLYHLLSEAVAEPVLIEAISGEATNSKKQPSAPFNYEDYVEGQRAKREASFFARNPRLVAAAKNSYGYQCQACNFRYSDRYVNVGDDFIEVHHLNPLSERSKTAEYPQLSNLHEVTVLCANCHRMIHRVIRRLGRPVSIAEFRQHIKAMEPSYYAETSKQVLNSGAADQNPRITALPARSNSIEAEK